MQILIIDDEEDSIAEIRERIPLEFPSARQEYVSFGGADEAIDALRPNMVILDLWQGELAGQDDAGSEFLEKIWRVQFCPIVVHSALPDIAADYESPFVKLVAKGGEGALHVIEAIYEFLPQIEALEKAETEIRNRLSVAVREVASEAFAHIDDSDRRIDVILRMSRRRLSAHVEGLGAGDSELQPWEQYIYPPVAPNFLLGDLIRWSDGERSDPENYRLVLTPSCDLVTSDGRVPKVDRILVARCETVMNGLRRFSLPISRQEALRRRLRAQILSAGYADGIIALPAFEPHIPLMVADCRKLELLSVSGDEIEQGSFERVASLDSPFRELVSWAYMNVSSRVGLPERHLDDWIELLAEQLGPGGSD